MNPVRCQVQCTHVLILVCIVKEKFSPSHRCLYSALNLNIFAKGKSQHLNPGFSQTAAFRTKNAAVFAERFVFQP